MLKQFQKEHKEWVDRVCPQQPALLPAAGMVEEAGELLHVAIAMFRRQTWGAEPRYPHLEGDMLDAMADCCIYACSYCNAKNWDFAQMMDVAPVEAADRTLLTMCVDLVRIAAEFVSCKSVDMFRLYIATLLCICKSQRIDLIAVTLSEWKKVRMR